VCIPGSASATVEANKTSGNKTTISATIIFVSTISSDYILSLSLAAYQPRLTECNRV
jgi:hypothetical protein